jgi:cold shock CspA family protein
MKGTVLDYDNTTETGTIEDQRGAQFPFNASQWSGQADIESGTVVNFKPKGSKKGPIAAQIVPTEPAAKAG